MLREKILKGRPRLVPRVSLSEVKLYLLKYLATAPLCGVLGEWLGCGCGRGWDWDLEAETARVLGASEDLGHRFAAAWVPVRAAFGDGYAVPHPARNLESRSAT